MLENRGGSHLYSAVTPVSYDDVSIGVHSHASGGIELAIAFTMWAKFKQELSICIVHLDRKSVQSHMASQLHLRVKLEMN